MIEAKRRRGKRGHGEGSINKLPSGRWRGRLMVGYHPDGKPDVRAVVGDTRKEVQLELRKLKQRVEEGLLGDAQAGRETVNTFLHRWLESIDGTMEPWSADRHRANVIHHIAPAIGHLKLADLRPEHVVSMMVTLRQKPAQRRASTRKPHAEAKPLSPRTLKYIHTTLAKALDMAAEWGAVPRNVARVTRAPKVPEAEVEALPPVDVARLLESATACGDRFAPLYTVAIFSGLRLGEVLSLKWADVDLSTGTIGVRRTLVGAKNGVPDARDPKTRRSRRSFTLPPDALLALRTQRARQNEERLALGVAYIDNGLVFATHGGAPLDRSNVLKRLKAALKRADLPEHYTFHSLRHSAATIMLASDVNPKVVADRLGHFSAGFTIDRYVHAVASLDIDAANRIQAFMDQVRRQRASG